MINVILAGASNDSPNRGGQALFWGAIEFISRKYQKADLTVSVLVIGNQPDEECSLSKEGYPNVTLKKIFYTKYDLVNAFMERRFLSGFGKKSQSKLSLLFDKTFIFYNINGGDSFSDIYGWNQFYNYAIPSIIAILCKIKLILLPQTIGPFNNYFVKRISRWILKKAESVYIRDEIFCLQLDKWHIVYEKSFDLSYYMKPQSIPEIKITDNSIGINVSGLMYFNRYKKLAGQFNLYPQLLLKIISYFQEHGLSIYLIPHTYTIENPSEDDDLFAIKDLYLKFQDKKNIYIIGDDYNAPQLKFLISKMRFFIGSRMHACFAALFSNVPTVGLAYSDKFVGSFKKFGSESNCIRINNLQNKEQFSVLEQIKIIFENIEKQIK